MTELYVIGVGADWCGKCAQAKMKLEPYNEMIAWIDISSDLGQIYEVTYDIKNLPFFILAWNKENRVITTSRSYMEVKKAFEKIQDKEK
jgi:hypothetical protein